LEGAGWPAELEALVGTEIYMELRHRITGQ
jgi:hypothetical protein